MIQPSTIRVARPLGLTLLAAFAALPLVAQTPAPSTAPGVAILDFNNGSVVMDMNYAPLSKGISDLLITELAANKAIRLVERDQIQKILDELDLAGTTRVDDATAARIGKLVGARYFLTGGFMVDPKKDMVLTIRSVNVETSEVEYTEKVLGKAENVIALIGELGRKVNTGLKLPQLPGRSAAAPAAAPKVSAEAQYRAFYLVSRSIEEQDKKNYPVAISLLKEALQVYPGFERAKVRLASLEKISG